MTSKTAKSLVEFVRQCQTVKHADVASDIAKATGDAIGWTGKTLYSGLVDYPAYTLANLMTNGAPAAARAKSQDAFNKRVSDATWQNITAAGAGGLGLGLAMRALQSYGHRPTSASTTFDPLEIPIYKPKEEEKKRIKKADAKPDLWTLLTNSPWMGAGMTAAGVGGAYGGYKALDALLDTQAVAVRDRELEEAKKRYENALRASYMPALKKAEEASPAEQAGAALDEAFSLLMSKQANVPQTPQINFDPRNNVVGSTFSLAANSYLPYAMALALVGGLGGYRLAAGQTRRSAVEEAASRRAASRMKNEAPELIPEYKVLPV